MNRRARLSGEITKTERAYQETLASFRQAEDDHQREIHVLNADLSATDRLIRQHEVGIDPNLIKPIRSQESSLTIGHGIMTRAIYECLKTGKGKPCNATQVTLFMASEMQLPKDATAIFSELRHKVRKRMQHLAWEGKITRVKSQVGSLEARWKLNDPAATQATFEQETHPADGVPASTHATSAKSQSQTFA